jgi:hypothetical protein
MSIHSLLPKQAENLLSEIYKNGFISQDNISDLSKYIGQYHKTADCSGRKVVSYVLWRVLLSYRAKYDGEPMTAEESASLVTKLQPTSRLLQYLQGSVELGSDEVIKITKNIIDLS